MTADLASGAGPVAVRLATDADADAMRAIYNREVVGSTVTFDLVPRDREEQMAWLAAHDGAHPATVAADARGEVVGFGSLSPWRDRPAYSTSVEDSVYVRDDQRGLGIGRVLLEDLVERATAHGFHAVFARIVGGHEASIALHVKLGFEVAGIEREVGRKFGRWLDVVVMERILSEGSGLATDLPSARSRLLT
jgi:L-amino acid N-acyltransferase YncA